MFGEREMGWSWQAIPLIPSVIQVYGLSSSQSYGLCFGQGHPQGSVLVKVMISLLVKIVVSLLVKVMVSLLVKVMVSIQVMVSFLAPDIYDR